MTDSLHPIRYVAKHTGLSQHTIRAWERRYAALSPDRTTTNRRLYSSEDIEKLSLLNRAVRAGHSIGQIAGLSVAQLQSLAIPETPAEIGSNLQDSIFTDSNQRATPWLEECRLAVERLNAQGLDEALSRAAAHLGTAALIDRVLLPLLNTIGEKWREGDLRPANEHMASAIIRTFLGRILETFHPDLSAPCLIVTTPVGQVHELGALIAAVTAASEGWRVLYLGPNLPADEIAGAALQSGAMAVALSIVYPPDDSRLEQEIKNLRTMIGPESAILAGGRSSAAYRAPLDSIRAIHLSDLHALRKELETLRNH
jgi:DNA-binding transcriptional MerR regulator/methylmalonyl-CoA mutase cobalamin-binding subunit